MKRVMDYEEFKTICLRMANEIKRFEPTDLVAVSRGGFSAAHIIAKELNLPIGVYYPKDGMLFRDGPVYGNMVVIEDLVAQGRTYRKMIDDFRDHDQVMNWAFAPVLIDGNLTITEPMRERLLTYGIRTKDWIVMPYEDEQKMVEGDRGLFRDGSDQYGRE